MSRFKVGARVVLTTGHYGEHLRGQAGSVQDLQKPGKIAVAFDFEQRFGLTVRSGLLARFFRSEGVDSPNPPE